jgi:hypothetical protein
LPLPQYLRLRPDELLGGTVHIDSLARLWVPEAGDDDATGAKALTQDLPDLHGADVRRSVRHADDNAGSAENELEFTELIDVGRLLRRRRRTDASRQDGAERSDQKMPAV